jgi:hypothetical protein
VPATAVLHTLFDLDYNALDFCQGDLTTHIDSKGHLHYLQIKQSTADGATAGAERFD